MRNTLFILLFCGAAQAVVLPSPQWMVPSEPLSTLDLLNYNYTRPADRPVPPGDSFVLAGTNTVPTDEAPQISGYTRQSETDRSMVLLGQNFSNPIVRAAGSNGIPVQLEVPVRRDDGVTAILPANRPYGMWIVWVENENGASWPVRVNATEAWWAGPVYAQPGGSLSVYGRNLSHNNSTNSSWIYLRPWGAGSNTVSTACTVTAVNPFKVTFTIPESLVADADYELWVHNGHGSEYGWSGPLKIRVESTPRYQWNGTVWQVPAPSGSNDTVAIQTVLTAAQPGETVRLQSGTYRIASRLIGTSGISFEGAGMTNTVIETLTGFTNATMLEIGLSGSRVRNLSFNPLHPVSSEIIKASGYGMEGTPEGFLVENIQTVSRPDTGHAGVTAGFCCDVTIRNCRFTGGVAVWINKGSQIFIEHNDFIGNATTNSSNSLGNGFRNWSVREVDFSSNTVDSLDRSQGLFARRGWYVQSPYGVSMDSYVGENTVTDTGPLWGGVNDNSGEQFLVETPNNIRFIGEPVSVNGTTLAFNPTNSWTVNEFITDDRPGWNEGEKSAAVICVYGGSGAGQWRKIIASGTNTVTVDRPWDVAPSVDSPVAIVESAERFVFYRNEIHADIDDNTNGIPDFLDRDIMATIGIGLYGAMNDVVVARNSISGMREGMFLYAFLDHPSHLEGTAVYDNIISGCRSGINVRPQSGTTVENIERHYLPLMLNVHVRDNRIENTVETALMLGEDAGFGDNTGMNFYLGGVWAHNNVFENNEISNAALGISLGVHQAQTVVRSNIVEAVDTGVQVRRESHSPVLLGNALSVTNLLLQAFGDRNGLLASWHFSEGPLDGQWGDVFDLSQNGFNGTSSGGPRFVEGRHLVAARFDGIDDFVVLDYPFTMESFSVAVDFKLVGATDTWLFSSDSIRFFENGTTVKLNGVDLQWDVRPLAGDGLWHRVVVTYDVLSHRACLYGDGELKESQIVNLGVMHVLNPMLIGAHDGGFLSGDIEKVSLWNRALSVDEIQSGVLTHWQMNDRFWTGLDGEVYDVAAGLYHGDTFGGVQTGDGKGSFSGNFDGTNDYIDIPYVFALDTFSFSAWFKMRAGGGLLFGSDGIRLLESNRTVQVAGTVLAWDTSSFSDDDTWHHIVVTRDVSSGQIQLYGDGVLRDSTVAGTQHITTTNNWRIGDGFEGRIDEVALWDRMLSSKEITQIYSGPIAHWKMDESSFVDVRVRDDSAYALHGEPTGSLESTIGKKSRAVKLNGTKGYIQISDALFFDSFTSSSWFRLDGPGSGSSQYVFASDSIGNEATQGIGFFYAGYIIRITGEEGSTFNNLVWNANAFTGDGKWHHVAVRYDAATGVSQVFGDGVLRDSVTNYLGKIRFQNTNGVPLSCYIGSRSANDNYFNGAVDELQLWDRPLSDDEIQQVYLRDAYTGFLFKIQGR